MILLSEFRFVALFRFAFYVLRIIIRVMLNNNQLVLLLLLRNLDSQSKQHQQLPATTTIKSTADKSGTNLNSAVLVHLKADHRGSWPLFRLLHQQLPLIDRPCFGSNKVSPKQRNFILIPILVLYNLKL